jgi:cbb3-type cytochrome c oxidase subunit II
MAWSWHRPLEGRGLTFSVLTFLAVVVGGLVLLIPPYFLQGTIEPIEGVRPYTGLEQEGRDIYVREGCVNCHSQMIRPFKTETDRYGPYSLAGESVYDRPFLYGSRRTGPDLARVGGKYPDSWHWLHLREPRQIEPRSHMPAYAFLTEQPLDLSRTERKLRVLRSLGHPYSDEEVRGAVADAEAQAATIATSLRSDGVELGEVHARSEAIAVIAYLQRLGSDLGWRQAAPAPPGPAPAVAQAASGAAEGTR